MLTSEQFLAQVEGYLAAKRMTATALGREALKDPAFVFELRKGRKPNLDVINRVISFMDQHPPAPERSAA